MKDELIQTASIFSEKGKDEIKVDIPSVPLVTSTDTIDPDSSSKEINYCKTIEFDRNAMEATEGIYMQTFFPDSLFGVIRNDHVDGSFAVHLQSEVIFEVPFESDNYEIVAVTQNVVVLMVNLISEDRQVYIVMKDGKFVVYTELTINYDDTHLLILDDKFDRRTSEEAPEETVDGLSVLSYPVGKFTANGGGYLALDGKTSKDRLLLSDHTGSYLGFYLKITEDGLINLHGKKCKMLSRATLALAVVVDTATLERYVLSCATQLLLPLEDYTDEEGDIIVENGIAILSEAVDEFTGHALNVFTPKHQRIVLEPGYKIDYKSFGNGIYFPKDNVLVLDNGSLIFTEPVSRNVVRVRGKEVKLPVEYLGNLDG